MADFIFPHPIHCLCCGRQLEPVDLPAIPTMLPMPNKATIVRISGNIFSNAFPILSDTEHLRAYLCDPCLKRAGWRGAVSLFTTAPNASLVPWQCGERPGWFVDRKPKDGS